MPYLLQNKQLSIHLDLPFEGYASSRFDQTGKISRVYFHGVELTGSELGEHNKISNNGRGFYNEFGIDKALGFEEANEGEYFHKIGVGLLKKTGSTYNFNTPYAIQKAKFSQQLEAHKAVFYCSAPLAQGYAYSLSKEITLNNNGFSAQYRLENTGEKTIVSDEYNHNFIALPAHHSQPNLRLNFSFDLEPEHFIENVNPDGAIAFHADTMHVQHPARKPFFFSGLPNGKSVSAQWEMQLLEKGIGIKEYGNFKTSKINVWGWSHVLSPELFFTFQIAPGKAVHWSRTWEFFQV